MVTNSIAVATILSTYGPYVPLILLALLAAILIGGFILDQFF